MDLQLFFNGPSGVKKSLFGGSRMTSSQVQGVQRIIVAHDQFGYGLDTALSYFLATSYHETGQRMQPVREAYGTSTEDTIARLDRAWAKGQLTWVKTPYWRDGWFGRGDVQLTHEANYSGEIRQAVLDAFPGCDIHAVPDLALRPDISAFIMIEGMTKGHTMKADFTGKTLESYIAPGKADYKNARQTVNPGDKPTYASIAAIALMFEAAIRAAREAAEQSFQDGVGPNLGLSAMATADTAVAAGDAPAAVATVGLMGGDAGRSILQGVSSIVIPDATPDDGDPYPATLYDGTANPTVQRVQELLTPMYPEVGMPDGKWGDKMEMIVLGFRSKRGLPLVPKIDDKLLAELAKPQDRVLSAARTTATATQIVERTGEPVLADTLQGLTGAKVIAIGGGLLGVGKGAMTLSDVTARLNDAQALYTAATNSLPLLGIAAAGGLGWWVLHRIKTKQVDNFRTAKLS